MTLSDRPNYQALDDALSIYRDEMRPFIVRNLRRVPRNNVETAIRTALRDGQYNQYEANRKSGAQRGRFPRHRRFPAAGANLLAG